MYVSMTGFGSAKIERSWGTISLEISSVNHRYQEMTVRLPKELSSREPWLHSVLRGKFHRGKVTARVEIAWTSGALAASLNAEVLTKCYRELCEIRDEVGSARDIAIESLLSLPGVIEASDRASISSGDDIDALLTSLVDDAAAAWNGMRAVEGSHLRDEIETHLSALEDIASKIEARWAPAKDAAFTAMTERINKALEAAGVSGASDDRFAQEAVIIADRWDIAEELARLASHIKKFREIGGADGAIGRKLDFLSQEMNREVNTINSKAADTEIRWLSVDAKAEIERIREQIQNLE